ncbi:hypothetical protein AU197_23445 [Mycobacterium sp. IS-1590]|uniref:hypothetical protein n=1 Tax=Mycobacterium sp. IS-1590 TaxID=1772286 RepID=UPI0007469E9C|nr:hypothetical protein [Mycobacterium sp. IS-1590]KUI43834.1 hypothetical protein AU197_23445 [Mycobacterium sp. IS-1590]
MVKIDRVRGDATGLAFPAHPGALRDGGPDFLTQAFRAYGALSDDNEVVAIERLDEVSGGSTGCKAVLTVRYAREHPDARTDLFVKFSRDFDDPVRDIGRTQMESETRFAALTRAAAFPIAVPATMFADFHRETGTGLMISERIAFGTGAVEPQYHKCLDYEMPDQVTHYRALLTALARLAGTERSGRLPADLLAQFPVDLRAATVGEPPVYSADQLDRRLRRLVEFVGHHEGLFPANVRSPSFLSQMTGEASELLQREADVFGVLSADADHLALCHWNANVDNAWFWRDDGELRCGLMDWGCVSRMNVAMAVWGSLSGAETSLWDHHLDELLEMFCKEVLASGGPALDPAAVERNLVLYATLMGVTWLLDVPALIRKRLPDAGPHTTRTDPRIKSDESVRAPLQMLSNVLNLWQTRGGAAKLAER